MNANTWIKAKGKLVYSPVREVLRKKRSHNDFILVAEMNGEIAKYYSWWIRKSLHLNVRIPAWKPHITILDGRNPVPDDNLHQWEKHAGIVIDFEYSVEVEQVWKFFVLPVRSLQLDAIRSELGFMPNAHGFHLTVGRLD